MSSNASAECNNGSRNNDYSYSHWRPSECSYKRRRKKRESVPTSNAKKHYISSYFCENTIWCHPNPIRFGDTVTVAKPTKGRYSDTAKPGISLGEISMALPSLLYQREIGVLSSRGYPYITSPVSPPVGYSRSDDSYISHVGFHTSRKMFSNLLLQTSRDQSITRGKSRSDSQIVTRSEQLHQTVSCKSLKPIWRPYAQRDILFSRLKTSPCDAVLGITYDGSSLVAIGPSNTCYEGSTNVVLRFYGIPSPHSLKSEVQTKTQDILSPVFCSIPFARIHSRENVDSYEDSNVSRVDIVLASNIGIALIAPHESEDNESVGNLFIFTLPYPLSAYYGSDKTTAFVLQSSGLTIKAARLATMKDVLWPTTVIPVPPSSFSNAALGTSDFEGYLLFNDEADGYRICWIQLSQGEIGYHSKKNQFPQLQYKVDASILCLPVSDVDWEGIINHPHDDEDCNRHGFLQVALMAYLHVDALLGDILSRRLSSFTTRQLPNFSYSLLSVESGRTVELVIVFQNNHLSLELGEGYSPPSLGVFVRLDLVTLSYEERNWTDSDADLCDETVFSKWCASLSPFRRAICCSNSCNILAKDWHESHSLQPALFDFMFKATDGTVFNDKNAFRKYEMLTRYTFHEVLNEQRIKKIGEVDGQPFEVINCRGSELIVLDHTDQVQIDNCVDCKILIGGSSESVFIRSCYNCIFTVACKQLRARDCQSCTFHLCSKTNPVIESSSQMRFGSFNGAYTGHKEVMWKANLNPEENLWYAVFDFSDPEKKFMNWSLLIPTEEGPTWCPLGPAPNCCAYFEPRSENSPRKIEKNLAPIFLDSSRHVELLGINTLFLQICNHTAKVWRMIRRNSTKMEDV